MGFYLADESLLRKIQFPVIIDSKNNSRRKMLRLFLPIHFREINTKLILT